MFYEQNPLSEHELRQANNQLNQQLAEIQLRQNLIAKLLSATNQNQGVKEYFHILNHDFMVFANEEDSLEDEAAALLELQAIGDELTVIGSYPEFYKKRSVAIAGGFSAGKSEFISSLFQDNSVRLPIGIEPTTAIPTYALNGAQNGLVGCSQNGGVINLLEIDPNFQYKLSHNFIRAFGFNLKTIMPFVFLTTPMAYQHLCFIDTPGYNPSDVAEGHTSEDIKTAEEFVQNAEALLWLIGLDANGTIPKSDLDFLDNVHQNINKPLYIVLNKADLRPHDQLTDIMDEVVDTLSDYDIEIAGISAYSAIQKTEYTYQKQSLFDFLNQLDTPSDKQQLILQRLHAIDEKYQRAILRSIKEGKQINKVLSGLRLDLLQEGFDDMGSEVYEKINKMNALFVSKHKDEMLHKLAAVMDKMEQTINQVFGQESSLKRKMWTLEEIELSEKYIRLTEKEELPDELQDKVSGSKNAQSVSENHQNAAHNPLANLQNFWKSKDVSDDMTKVLTALYEKLEDKGKSQFGVEDFCKVAAKLGLTHYHDYHNNKTMDNMVGFPVSIVNTIAAINNNAIQVKAQSDLALLVIRGVLLKSSNARYKFVSSNTEDTPPVSSNVPFSTSISKLFAEWEKNN